MAPSWLTVTQVALALQTHPEVVRRWLRQGRLDGVKIGRAWRVPRATLPPLAATDPSTNWIAGRVQHVDAVAGIAWVRTAGEKLAVQARALRRGNHVRVQLDAEDILVSHRRLHGISARNQWAGKISSLVHGSSGVEVEVDTRPPLVAWLTNAAVRDLDLRPNMKVVLVFKTGACRVQIGAAGSARLPAPRSPALRGHS